MISLLRQRVGHVPAPIVFMVGGCSMYLGAALAVGLFVVMPAFPRANILLTIVLGIVGCAFIWMSFALLGAAVPKVGGDYVFNGRILHPIFGLAGNLGAFVAACLEKAPHRRPASVARARRLFDAITWE